MPLPADFKEHGNFMVLTGLDANGMDVGCECGGWFHAFRTHPKNMNRPKGEAWCKCDKCGAESFQPVQRSA